MRVEYGRQRTGLQWHIDRMKEESGQHTFEVWRSLVLPMGISVELLGIQ